MKKILSFFKNKFYFKFILYILGFSGLTIGLFYLDKSIQDTAFSQTFTFSQVFLTSMLIMIIGSIITIITITFSTIMVVLTLYSGQFSPRTLNDFLQRKVPLNILGYFIGVSVYAMIGLAITANYQGFVFPTLTLFAMMLFLVGIILFAYYVHYVSKSVQINIYIDKLVKDAISEIEKYQTQVKENENICLEESEDQKELEYDKEYKSHKTGYFSEIDINKLLKVLEENDIVLTVVKPYNEHVFEDDVLFKYHSKKSFTFEKDFIDECFIYTDEPSNFSEYRNQTLKLVEIAVRALSPGVNDPVTAKVCIDQLGFIFKKLSDAHYSLHYKTSDGKQRLIIKTMNFDLLLYDHFYQILLYGKQDLKIISSLIRALTRISTDSNRDKKESLWNFALYIIKELDIPNMHPYDLREINYELKELAIKLSKVEEYKKMLS